MPNLARIARPETQSIARPVKTLIPLIRVELDHAEDAGMDHYRRAGEMLIEARDQVAAFKWGKWLVKHFELGKTTAYKYMKLAEVARTKPAQYKRATSLREAIGEPRSDYDQRIGNHQPIGSFTAGVDADQFNQGRQTADDEIALHRDLAIDLVEIGYKALAVRLHPDHGGSHRAMRRLNRVAGELRHVAKTRRYD